MIRRIEGLPRGVFAFEVDGLPTREIVDEVMIDFDATVGDSYDMALLIEFLPTLQSNTAFAELRFEDWLSARGRIRRFVFVGDERWRETFNEFARFVGGEARMFARGKRDAALDWLLKASFLSAPDVMH